MEDASNLEEGSIMNPPTPQTSLSQPKLTVKREKAIEI
jgi:hypothetical protein